jgi:hypothetical protein
MNMRLSCRVLAVLVALAAGQGKGLAATAPGSGQPRAKTAAEKWLDAGIEGLNFAIAGSELFDFYKLAIFACPRCPKE